MLDCAFLGEENRAYHCFSRKGKEPYAEMLNERKNMSVELKQFLKLDFTVL